jgi:TPP-dependent pyruvate/acetoin dehydrogenase alpha subunit/pyruvate/2-oxoglutarate/acetoin dehydrogenase E1 component
MASRVLISSCRLSSALRLSRSHRCDRFLTTANDNSYNVHREGFSREIEGLPEHQASVRLVTFLDAKANQQAFDHPVISPVPPPEGGYDYEMDSSQIRSCLDAAMATFCLHIESRIASMIGHGFYTIGPCGEEALSSIGCAISPQDSLALHYRHSGVNIARQLLQGESLEQILMDRARGYTVSRQDPVTGGVHCSIGSDPSSYSDAGAGDFIVTSTLASQCPSAVGRALAYSYVSSGETSRRNRPISMVTLGDGSVHNHHFWSAFHLARHARHKKIKCPVLFGISDNGLSISYKTDGYVDTLFANDPLIPLFRVNGNDMMHVYSQTKSAAEYARKQSAPAVILYKNLVRRFGHAATDRQSAYLEMDDIKSMADNTVLESTIQQVVEDYSAISYPEVCDRLQEIQTWTRESFARASQEEKVTRQDMLDRVAAKTTVWRPPETSSSGSLLLSPGKPEVMRKHMTRVLTEVMTEDDSVVYLGEDVRHGGYYIVTEGLASKFPTRVLDFPPDETSLLGAGMGFAQVGLTPIVEIPYAKYLDCGVDMFYEIAISNWLSDGKRPNGMIVRLQGFDRGLFGGNFHTTNVLPHVPPGVDLVCFSNGEDYVRGFRNAVAQAKAGRVVVSVDCTNLLNLRHLHGKDRGWERIYPQADAHGSMGFDEVRRYGTGGATCIVTYGNGVVTALQARRVLLETGVIESEDELDIVDCPYLSSVSVGLRDVLRQYDRVLFADICKEGPGGGVLCSLVTSLHSEGALPTKWEVVAAPRTYNPLGNMCTFLNVDDITEAFKGVQRLSPNVVDRLTV